MYLFFSSFMQPVVCFEALWRAHAVEHPWGASLTFPFPHFGGQGASFFSFFLKDHDPLLPPAPSAPPPQSPAAIR